MKNRCLSTNYWCYQRYGGRGIKVAERWLGKKGFANFLEDMGKKPNQKYSLDRINNEGDYTPDNCKWSSQKEQVHNSSKMVWINVDGVTDTMSNHAKRYGVSVSLYYKRKKAGYSDEESFKTPNDGQENRRKIRKAEMLSKIRDCLYCGKKCKSTKTKFCCGSCYMYYRNRNS